MSLNRKANSRKKILIVDPLREARSLLRQRLSQCVDYSGIVSKNTVGSASVEFESISYTANAAGGNLPFDLTFISLSFSDEKIIRFIDFARSSPLGRDGIYITTAIKIDEDIKKRLSPDSPLIDKIDGCLIEPVTTRSILECIQLGETIKKKRILEQEEKMIKMLTETVVNLVDEIANAKQENRSYEEPLNELKNLAEMVKQFSPRVRKVYYSLLTSAAGGKNLLSL